MLKQIIDIDLSYSVCKSYVLYDLVLNCNYLLLLIINNTRCFMIQAVFVHLACQPTLIPPVFRQIQPSVT